LLITIFLRLLLLLTSQFQRKTLFGFQAGGDWYGV